MVEKSDPTGSESHISVGPYPSVEPAMSPKQSPLAGCFENLDLFLDILSCLFVVLKILQVRSLDFEHNGLSVLSPNVMFSLLVLPWLFVYYLVNLVSLFYTKHKFRRFVFMHLLIVVFSWSYFV